MAYTRIPLDDFKHTFSTDIGALLPLMPELRKFESSAVSRRVS